MQIRDEKGDGFQRREKESHSLVFYWIEKRSILTYRFDIENLHNSCRKILIKMGDGPKLQISI